MGVKGPRFTFENSTITDAKTGAIGQVIQKGQSYLVHLTAFGNINTPQQKEAVAKRMADWYVFTQVKPKQP